VFDTETNQLMKKILCNGFPFQVTLTNQGQQVDVLNEIGSAFIQFINTVSGKVSPSTAARGLILHPSGMISNVGATTLYFADYQDYVTVCNAKTGTVENTFLAVPNVFNAVSLGQPAITPSGTYLYVPYVGTGAAKGLPVSTAGPGNAVAMIDVSSGTIVGPLITVGNEPVWAAVSPDGNTLYVCNSADGTVSVIDITPQ
jgi:DNA-binding beta-propeller fold protein YncE